VPPVIRNHHAEPTIPATRSANLRPNGASLPMTNLRSAALGFSRQSFGLEPFSVLLDGKLFAFVFAQGRGRLFLLE
jgi:hypothetical protein